MHLRGEAFGRAAVFAALMVAAGRSPASAQLAAANDGPIAYGHHHLNVTSIDAHKKFWIEALGGKAVKVGTSPAEIVEFPNVLIFLTPRAPTGGTKGTVVNHVGFETSNLRAAVDRLKASGFPMITRAELPDTYVVKDDLGQRDGGNIVAFVMGPDDTKVELIENTALAHPIAMHHVHFAAPDVAAMKAWYVKTFAARPSTRAGFESADLPGVNLTFGGTTEPVVPTRGRSVDHIGFEVKQLQEFCKQLEASGITLDRPYTKVPALNVAVAFLTDPWGTYIELTEGLAAIP
jgi:catechol 2,3-dioxygenase-like lactoylglutathione lyase family enzyme